MLDIQYIRDNPKEVQEKSKQKGYKIDINGFLKLDTDRKKLLQEVEALRQKRNELADRIKKGGKPDQKLIDEGKNIKADLSGKEKEFGKLDEQWQKQYKQIPNMPTDDVPIGNSEEDNKVIKTVGEKTKFDFEPKNHWELGEKKDWIDKKRAAKVAGARFSYLKGDLVKLQFALFNFGLHVLTNESTLKTIADSAKLKVSTKPFIPVLPPPMIKTDVYEATGRLNGADVTYKLEDDDLWLNGSAEHSLCAMYKDEILDENELPIRFAGYTTSFRREAGNYGKDMEGIIRTHSFDKLEMESFTTKEDSMNEHLFLIAIQEYLMQQLDLPYQVVSKCTADIGFPNARGVDIEAWLPGQNKYRETHSADLITDFQARSLQTRVRRGDGSIEYAHTNDATAFSQRPLIAILENYQTSDGNVLVPEILKPYM